MKIVIEIDDEIYKTWRQEGKYASHSYAQKIILNGKPLPKGHGDLKDADIYKTEVNKYIAENKNSDDLYLAGCGDGAYHALHIYNCIPTIIGNDKRKTHPSVWYNALVNATLKSLNKLEEVDNK